ncbi:MAG: hypothetical protein QXV17_09170 [Candidatus Micrarchaeaceae archaeon]
MHESKLGDVGDATAGNFVIKETFFGNGMLLFWSNYIPSKKVKIEVSEV